MKAGDEVICVEGSHSSKTKLNKIETDDVIKGHHYILSEIIPDENDGFGITAKVCELPQNCSYGLDHFRKIKRKKFRNKLTAKLAIEHVEEVGIEEYQIETV